MRALRLLTAGGVLAGQLALAAAAGALPPAPTPAVGSVRVRLSRVSPAQPQTASTLLVGVTVANTSGQDLTGLSIGLARGPVVDTRAQLAALRAMPSGAGAGGIKPLRALRAGATERYVLSVPVTSVLAEDRVTELSVQVLAGGVVLGRADLPLSYFPAGLQSPVHVAVVLPVTEAPDQGPVAPAGPATPQVPSPAFIDDLSPGGRLDTVVQAALHAAAQGGIRSTAVTLAVDPALLVRVCAVAHKCAPAQVSPGASAQDTQIAGDWLARLEQAAALPSVTLVGLPYADADVAALADSGHGQQAGQLLATADRQVHGILTQASASTFQPLLPDGPLTPALAQAAGDVGVHAAVVSADQAPPVPQPDGSPPTQTATARLSYGNGVQLSALVTDTELQQLLNPPPDDDSVGHIQDLLAELGVITSEAPSDRDVRTIVLEAPRRWHVAPAFATGLIDQLAAAPFVTTESLADAAAEAPAARGRDSGTASQLLPMATLGRISTLSSQVDELKALAATPRTEQLTPPLYEQLERAASVAWRPAADPAAGTALLDAVAAELPQNQPQNAKPIQLGANDRGVLLTGASGTLPVAVNNALKETVRVVLLVVSDPPGQVTGKPVVETLPAGGGSRQISIPITARSTRRTTVTVSVHPYAAPNAPALFSKTVSVRSTAVGVVAVGITAGALTVLVLAIVIRVVRKLHRRRRATA